MEGGVYSNLRLATEISQILSVIETKFGTSNADADLTELKVTIQSAKSLLLPYAKDMNNLIFDICVQGIQRSLEEIKKLVHNFKDILKKEDKEHCMQRRIALYKEDFKLKQKLDQFISLFPKEGKTQGVDMLVDPEAKQFWKSAFGEKELMIRWATFFHALEMTLGEDYKEEEDAIREFIDFADDGFVTPYEFNVFLQWFGPLKGCCVRLLKPLEDGMLCGFCPALEADNMLNGKSVGTYLIRFSKTRVGSYAITFVDAKGKVKHCLLYSVQPAGVTLRNPPQVYSSLSQFACAHQGKLKIPAGNDWSNKTDWKQKMEEKRKKAEGSNNNNSNNVIIANVNNFSSVGMGSPVLGRAGKGNAKNGRLGSGGDDDDGQEHDLCTVCMDEKIETVFLECAHMACCVGCSKKLTDCPICRAHIKSLLKVFKS